MENFIVTILLNYSFNLIINALMIGMNLIGQNKKNYLKRHNMPFSDCIIVLIIYSNQINSSDNKIHITFAEIKNILKIKL